MSLGALPIDGGRTRFRVWAPLRRSVDVVLEERGERHALPLTPEAAGHFEAVHPARAGARYRYRLDGGESFPDPCSRFQPEGPDGPSEVVDPSAFAWSDGGFRGLTPKGQVLYEVHVGAYTPEGTFAALERELPALRALGVTAIELMPLNGFPGRFNWGYDGVNLYAPNATYGVPDDLRRLVQAAHALGLGVLVDVVYNHLGPEGNYLGEYSGNYFTDRYPNEWGDPPNLDGPGSGPVREFFLQNACAWVFEYHLDGLRVDATQSLYDASPRHLTAELAERVRSVAPAKALLLIAESEPQDGRLVTPLSEGGSGMDAIWVDDFHHATRVAATGNAEAYCQDYRGQSQELLACALRNSLYQGQWYAWQGQHRGSPLRGLSPDHAVFYLQNHDQIANTLRGERLHQTAGPARARALTGLWLLLPQTPLLFMGQEFFASTPFLFFVDHADEKLQALVDAGRAEFLGQFETARRGIQEGSGRWPMPAREAFAASRLKLEERAGHPEALALHRSLIALRQSDPLFHAPPRGALEGATLSAESLVLRWTAGGARDRLLLFNLGVDLPLPVCSEPLLAAPPGHRWRLVLSTEETRFGGAGAVAPDGEGPWRIPGQATVVLAAEERRT